MVENEAEKSPNMVDISTIDVFSLLSLFINILTSQAWQYMGLRINTKTNKVEKDFPKASVAIDCISFLIKKLEPELNQEDQNRLRALLSDLQINFVKQMNKDKKV